MTVDKDHPFYAKIIDRTVLNRPGSKKCTVHLTLDISGSGIRYKVGDSIAVFPENATTIVLETLEILGCTPDEKVRHPRTEKEYTIKEYLIRQGNLSKVTKKCLVFILEHVSDQKEQEKLQKLTAPENKEALKEYCDNRQLWDCLNDFKSFKATAQELVDVLPPLLPRFYSIASSHLARGQELDLLIAYFHYTTNEHLRHGVASHYLCESADMHLPCIPIYLHPSKGFTTPSDHSTPIIMVGPGTGVAPFRGFMQERIAQKAKGKNWLFFGDWNEAYDFYYEDYFKELASKKQLKLSTAFSRDQKEKVYVQDRMHEQAKELYEWLEDGAYFYVCGDAQRMAKDVDQMLHTIIEEQGQMSSDEAKAYVKTLKDDGRYIRDVY